MTFEFPAKIDGGFIIELEHAKRTAHETHRRAVSRAVTQLSTRADPLAAAAPPPSFAGPTAGSAPDVCRWHATATIVLAAASALNRGAICRWPDAVRIRPATAMTATDPGPVTRAQPRVDFAGGKQ
jgi:hypothetical protein